MRWLVIVLAVYGCCFPTRALEWRESRETAAAFAEAGVTGGTFVLYDVAGEVFVGHDRERAETRFIPASTFKIVNALIGLSVGAVRDVDEILPYGGQRQSVKEWERDMSLRDAIRISNVPIFQELARRIGLERMRSGLTALGYGNADPGSVVDRFWLDGPLGVSAVEQVRFLARLAQGELPLSPEVQASVRDIVRLERGDGWELYGKTGSAMRDKPYVGWWVGWVSKGDRVYTFALNLDMADVSEFGKRVEVGKACLKALGVL